MYMIGNKATNKHECLIFNMGYAVTRRRTHLMNPTECLIMEKYP